MDIVKTNKYSTSHWVWHKMRAEFKFLMTCRSLLYQHWGRADVILWHISPMIPTSNLSLNIISFHANILLYPCTFQWQRVDVVINYFDLYPGMSVCVQSSCIKTEHCSCTEWRKQSFQLFASTPNHVWRCEICIISTGSIIFTQQMIFRHGTCW